MTATTWLAQHVALAIGDPVPPGAGANYDIVGENIQVIFGHIGSTQH